jgi:hypothetical protein
MVARSELGASLLQRWPVATMVWAMPLLGCGPGGVDTEVFRVTAVDYDGDDTLTLTFTKPIANAGEIDPNDFRISFARTYRFVYTDPYGGVPETYSYTSYTDLAGFVSDDYNYNYNDRFSFASAALGGPDQLVLEMTDPLGTSVCDTIEYIQNQLGTYAAMYPGLKYDVGMFVHYAGQGIPLQAENGEALADIGPDWVLDDVTNVFSETYGFMKLNPRLEIPCP